MRGCRAVGSAEAWGNQARWSWLTVMTWARPEGVETKAFHGTWKGSAAEEKDEEEEDEEGDDDDDDEDEDEDKDKDEDKEIIEEDEEVEDGGQQWLSLVQS